MLSFGSELSRYCQTFLRLIYPPFCSICQVPLLLDETYLCVPCRKALPLIHSHMCLKCAMPLPPYGDKRLLCAPCRYKKVFYDHGFSIARYEEPLKELFRQIKFRKKPWLLNIFKPSLHSISSFDINRYDLVIPVPLDSKRLRERGFNQAEIIARMLLAGRKGRNTRLFTGLRKTRPTSRQSQLTREERLKNLKGVFALSRSQDVHEKEILLVDDIVTTGSTVTECARLLKEKGAERVDFFSLARS